MRGHWLWRFFPNVGPAAAESVDPRRDRRTNLVVMCMNCLSTAETAIATAAFVGYAAKPRLHRAMAKLGVANEPDPVAHDVTTVAFLRSLDLDPVEVLGADVVAAAAAWIPPQPAAGLAGLARRFASARPIGSQSLLTAQ